MRRYPSRADYEAIQRARTAAKWALNSITREEVAWYRDYLEPWDAHGPILCLGVRNGLEVDLFREAFGVKVQGVELHPLGARRDVWVGSFDALPPAWAGRYRLLYSNSLDHAYDPVETTAEWRRVAAPGAHLALSIAEGQEPTATDPIGDIRPEDLLAWFPGAELVAALERPNQIFWQLWKLP